MAILKPLSGDPSAPQQHKQTSRKGKKAWRKNVDVSEVQEGLEEMREEVIEGYDELIHGKTWLQDTDISIVEELSQKKIQLISSLLISREMQMSRKNIAKNTSHSKPMKYLPKDQL